MRWLGASLLAVRAFPRKARQVAGYQVWRVQQGMEPTDWKPVPSLGAGVREIRIRIGRDFRVIYAAQFPEAIYVLHAFEKRTQKTPRADVRQARERFRRLRLERERGTS